MQQADGWLMCRVGFVEAVQAVGLVAGRGATKAIADEWARSGSSKSTRRSSSTAAALALERGLRSLHALHLAAALVLPEQDLVFAAWDHRLHAAARAEGLQTLPDTLD